MLKDSAKEAMEAVANHPKASLVVTAAFTSNVWLDYGLPIVQGVTSIAGMFVVILLAIKHSADVYKIWKNKDNE